MDVYVSWIDQRGEPHTRMGGIGVQSDPVSSSVGESDSYACDVASHSEDDLIGAHVVVSGVGCQPHPRAERRPLVAALRVMSVEGLHLKERDRIAFFAIRCKHPSVPLE